MASGLLLSNWWATAASSIMTSTAPERRAKKASGEVGYSSISTAPLPAGTHCASDTASTFGRHEAALILLTSSPHRSSGPLGLSSLSFKVSKEEPVFR